MTSPQSRATDAVVELHPAERSLSGAQRFLRAALSGIEADGQLVVTTADGRRLRCDWLDAGPSPTTPLAAGDTVLVAVIDGVDEGVVLGRVGRYQPPRPAEPVEHLRLEASQRVTLSCGEASIDLRADGKVMVRGDDVLLRAKGTQRIRAGTVAIN